MLRDLFSLFPAYAGVILGRHRKVMRGATFPRIRGGDPSRPQAHIFKYWLFPAYAGVIPYAYPLRRALLSFPRIRGGDPGDLEQLPQVCSFSPHTRG